MLGPTSINFLYIFSNLFKVVSNIKIASGRSIVIHSKTGEVGLNTDKISCFIAWNTKFTILVASFNIPTNQTKKNCDHAETVHMKLQKWQGAGDEGVIILSCVRNLKEGAGDEVGVTSMSNIQ